MQAISLESLKSNWIRYRAENPKRRIYDAAQDLNVSEEVLLLIDSEQIVTPLIDDVKLILNRVKELGRVMALTRNHDCVIETYGVYEKLGFHGTMGIALNPGIDLRIFLTHWAHAYAVESRTGSYTRRSLQFFNSFGQAIHKIYVRDDDHIADFEKLREELRSSRAAGLPLSKVREHEVYPPLSDSRKLLNAWEQLKDVHDFHKLLKDHQCSRIDAMRAVAGTYSTALPPERIQDLFKCLAQADFNFMVFVGNQEMIQIYTGQAKNYQRLGSWDNFLEADFNLHLDRSAVKDVFVVKKPSTDGEITSIELYNNQGSLICQFFGERKPGRPELEAWRQLVGKLV